MATEKQKQAARRNLEKARSAQAVRRRGPSGPPRTPGLSTNQQSHLPDSVFAFPQERKEPLIDAAHVRNALARFDQVEGVSDAERDEAWRRIRSAAYRYDVDISESSWHELMKAGQAAQEG
jgi:hypothetical protein